MITGRPKKLIALSEGESAQLRAMLNSRSLRHELVRRARIILMTADGISNKTIAERFGLSHQTVYQWRQRYLQQGLGGLHDELRPGRPRSVSDEEVVKIEQFVIQYNRTSHPFVWTATADSILGVLDSE